MFRPSVTNEETEVVGKTNNHGAVDPLLRSKMWTRAKGIVRMVHSGREMVKLFMGEC